MKQWFDRLIEHTALLHDKNAVRPILEYLTREAGFTSYAYLNIHGNTQSATSNYAFDWQKRYFAMRYVFLDPVVLRARTMQQAFSWSNAETRWTPNPTKRFFGEASEFGIRSGITIPISTGYRRLAMLTLASDDPQLAKEKALNAVAAAGALGQLNARLELLRAPPTLRTSVALKPKELNCLRWIAEGKSMDVIATIENTSYANVRHFLRGAKKALGARTLPQATAIGKEFGII